MNKVGFGFLRLPMRGESGKEIDLAALNQMVDTFLEQGKMYFDTAYTYLEGRSEWAIRESLVKRYPRESFILADKLPGYQMHSWEDCQRTFQKQLERCGVAYFDVYLLHWLNEANYTVAEEVREFDFLKHLKKSGKVRKIGFSYHDTADLLEKILTRHPEVDYVQLQINYLDWESPSIQARRCYETAVRHGKQIIVMEPVKGGTLAKLPQEVEQLLRELDPAASAASFAIRFAESLPQVAIVLSGMNTMEQLLDNLQDHQLLSVDEKEVLRQVAAQVKRAVAIPCTGCGYCLSGCPKHISIPGCFALYNEYVQNPKDDWKIIPAYRSLVQAHGRAGDCIGCGNCEKRCPQQLPIRDNLRKASFVFDS